jgi:NADH-quinone oxidoreductase subunit F
MLKRIRDGGGRLEDLDILQNLANNMGIMPGTTICGLADGAAWPVKNALAKFRPEIEEYIRTHQSGARRVTPLQETIYHGQSTEPVVSAALPVLNSPNGTPRLPYSS